jgi:hypothetical protein
MNRHRSPVVTGLVFVFALGFLGTPPAGAQSDTLPDRLTDAEFWQLVQDFSEPDGYFRSDNLLSNEVWFQETLPDLIARTGPASAYLGVGPEQNFTYIAALRPKIAFITDIRRGNLWSQLMYKALFELSADRAEFVSRLFSKPRPSGLSAASTANELFDAYWDTPTASEQVFERNARDVIELLTVKHNLALSEADRQSIIEHVYHYFYWFGPGITYNSSSNSGRGSNRTTYYDLMVATDLAGMQRSYLASEESFRFLKTMQERNLIVPVVGNFAGPRSLRAVGGYLRRHGATVTAFYLSNVEQYLVQDGIWTAFCSNVATLPLDEASTFIRSGQGGRFGGRGGLINSLGAMQAETQACTP